ncbi:MAG TPA: glycosyltransferase, partial [Chitinophagaceae bacterium]|nr:glycosyltransferase [Chitinophagaceae bacterium]
MKHILWLASWYPDEINPYNGDFIQRHAQAVAEFVPLTVVYVAQHGPGVNMPASKMDVNVSGNLTEIIIYFPYKKTGIQALDTIVYNWKLFHHYKKFMRQYLVEKGKPDIVHVHVPMKAGRIALWMKAPYIVTEHSSAYSDEVPDSYHRRGAYYRKWVRRIFENAKALTTVSKKLGHRLTELFGIQNMHIIPNVTNTKYFSYAPVKPSRFRFLHASTMDHPKNVEGILRTLHRLKQQRTDWECVMLGWDTPALKKLCDELNLNDHVQWKGVVSYRQVAIEMQHSSALLMFSRYENQPCVILEALCCGLPVIATKVGGIPELIDDSNGILVEPGNEDQLLNVCIQCMNEYHRFDGASIAQRSQRIFSYEAVGKQFAGLYD